jgi:hypothetical protein
MMGIEAMDTANTTNANIAQVLFDPVAASSIDIGPMNQGVRFYYNTVTMVMVILPQFFFGMARGISAQTNTFSLLSLKKNIALRLGVSISFTSIASLCMAGYIWGFREDWGVASGQFALTWMAVWLAMHLDYFIIDSVTAVTPISLMPFFILTWVIMNVASTLTPFELSPGW